MTEPGTDAYRACSMCGQRETRIVRMDGTEPYYLHLDNENPHCQAGPEAPADSYSAGASPSAKGDYTAQGGGS